MGTINDFLKKRNEPAKKDAGAAPEGGVKRFIYLGLTYFWNLLGINLLFVVCCIPIITIPAALCAMNRYMIKMVRDGYGTGAGDFLKEYRNELFKSLPIGILTAFFLVYGIYLASIASQLEGGEWLKSVAMVCFFLAAMIGGYAFLLLAMFELNLGAIMKNTMILIFAEWKRTILLVAWVSVMTFLPLYFFPLSVPFLILIWFSISQLGVCCILNGAIQSRIIDPYEKTKNKGAN